MSCPLVILPLLFVHRVPANIIVGTIADSTCRPGLFCLSSAPLIIFSMVLALRITLPLFMVGNRLPAFLGGRSAFAANLPVVVRQLTDDDPRELNIVADNGSIAWTKEACGHDGGGHCQGLKPCGACCVFGQENRYLLDK